ncbi:MAG: DUF3352 domain-containing protein [Acaryochloris sp. SU_5_25]|nr:DUF3352 domain-containing protein [Acaryochloris sp. SU_5_25]
MVKLRSILLQICASILALFLWGGVVWAVETDPPGVIPQPEPAVGPTSARFVPGTTPLMISLLGNSTPLKVLGNETEGSAPQLTDLPTQLLAGAGINYREDIRPWVSDELTFALTAFDQDPGQSGTQPGYLLVVKTRSSKDADAFLESFWQRQVAAGRILRFERSAGVDIIAAEVSSANTAALLPPIFKPIEDLITAKVEERFVLVANQNLVLQQAIATLKNPTQQLAQQPNYQKAIATFTAKQPEGIAYLNLATLIPEITGKPTVTAPTYASLGVAFGESRQGLLAETALVAHPERQLPSVAANQLEPPPSLSYFPGNSPLVVSGAHLGKLWVQISQDLQGYPGIQSWVNQALDTWGKTRGVNLTNKIFPWVDGGYAWALLPHSLSPVLSAQSDPDPDWLFAYEQTQSDPSKQLAKYLNELASQQDLGTSPFELAGHKVFAWTRLVSEKMDSSQGRENLTFKTKVTGAYADLDNQKVLASSPEALGLGLEAGNGALINQRQFQEAIAPFDQPNQGFLYLDWPIMKPLLEQNLPFLPQLKKSAPSLFNKLHTLSVSSYGETPDVQHSQWYFRFSG